FFIVQGIRFHVQDEIYFALGFYAIFVMLTVISVSCWKRGKGHYHYHAHIENKNLGNKNI
ncbi:MAG: hypothetical protein QXK37_06640, partial [Candidatus Woesearchaeota archaeon]